MLFMGEITLQSLNSKIERFGFSGPVLGLVRICARNGGKNQHVILENSFLDTYKINLGISIEPVYHPDLKKIFLLLVNSFLYSANKLFVQDVLC